MINAKVGDKIVCINAKRAPTTTLETGLTVNEIYTVRWIGMHRHYLDGDYFGVRLAEIDRGDDPSDFADHDMPFRASRFKPVVTPKVSTKTRIEVNV
jgi:hypothetical protein